LNNIRQQPTTISKSQHHQSERQPQMLIEKPIKMSPAEWQLWKDHPLTALVFEALQAERSRWVEEIVWGGLIKRPAGLAEVAEATGIIKGLTILLEGFELTLQQQWDEMQAEKERTEENGE
jgi:hypothetical protein